jgi:hypothetical protein
MVLLSYLGPVRKSPSLDDSDIFKILDFGFDHVGATTFHFAPRE